MYLAGCLPYYLFSYIAEGSFDAYQYQLIESKARFIDQALAGEITARTVEDTSDVVLSAAEIKAIASGNPQIVRKVQLEAEVARLERVRGVWLDTRRNLQLERHFSEEEIRRAEGRRAQWERAEAIVAAHPHEPFCAEVAASVGSERFSPMTARAEAGATVRRLAHDYQSAAAFQRQRLRGVIAHYRGLDLVVQAHAVFAADLSLALPDGTTLDTITAATDTGVWQSVGHIVSDIPSVVKRLRGRIAESNERIATIDRELARLEQWDGQATYDAALCELQAINATFAAAEEQDAAEPGVSTTPTAESTSQQGTAASPDEPPLSDLLLALAQEERADDGWGEWQPVIPPAPTSLAFMAAEAERQVVSCLSDAQPVAVVQEEEVLQLPVVAEGERLPTPAAGVAQFGDTRAKHRPQRPTANAAPHDEAAVSQLPLF